MFVHLLNCVAERTDSTVSQGARTVAAQNDYSRMGAIEHMQLFLANKKHISTPTHTIPLDCPLPSDFWTNTPDDNSNSSDPNMPPDLESGEIDQSDSRRDTTPEAFASRQWQHRNAHRASASAAASTTTPSSRRGSKAKKKKPGPVPFPCTLCGVTVFSQVIYDAHVRGKGHQTKLRNSRLSSFNREIAEHGRAAAEAAGPAPQRDVDTPTRNVPPRPPPIPQPSTSEIYRRESKAPKDDVLVPQTHQSSSSGARHSATPFTSPPSNSQAVTTGCEKAVAKASRTVTPDPTVTSLIEDGATPSSSPRNVNRRQTETPSENKHVGTNTAEASKKKGVKSSAILNPSNASSPANHASSTRREHDDASETLYSSVRQAVESANIEEILPVDEVGKNILSHAPKSSNAVTDQGKRFQPVSSDPTISRSRPGTAPKKPDTHSTSDTAASRGATPLSTAREANNVDKHAKPRTQSPGRDTPFEGSVKRRKPDDEDRVTVSDKDSARRGPYDLQRPRSRSEDTAAAYVMNADGSQRRKLNSPVEQGDEIQRGRHKERDRSGKSKSEQKRRSTGTERSLAIDERRHEDDRRRSRDDLMGSGELDTRGIPESRLRSKDVSRRERDDRRRSSEMERNDERRLLSDSKRREALDERRRSDRGSRDGLEDRRRSTERRRDILDDWRAQADRDRPEALDERWRPVVDRDRDDRHPSASHDGLDERVRSGNDKRPVDSRRRIAEDKRGYSPDTAARRSPSDENAVQTVSYDFLRESMPMSEWRELRRNVLERGSDVEKVAYKILQELIVSPVTGVDFHTLAPFSKAMMRSLNKQYITKDGPVAKRSDFPAELRWLDSTFAGQHGNLDTNYSQRQEEHDALWNIRDNVWFIFNNHEQPDKAKGPSRALHPPRGTYGENKLRRLSGPMIWDRGVSRYDDGVVTDPLYQAIMESLIRREEQGPAPVPPSAQPPGPSAPNQE